MITRVQNVDSGHIGQARIPSRCVSATYPNQDAQDLEKFTQASSSWGRTSIFLDFHAFPMNLIESRTGAVPIYISAATSLFMDQNIVLPIPPSDT